MKNIAEGVELITEQQLSKEQKKNIALEYMSGLKIRQQVIDQFKENDKLLCSKGNFIVDVPEDILKQIRAWENEFKNMVYHVVYSDIYGCKIYNALSVSCYAEDRWYESKLITESRAAAHCINITIPEYTDSGSIALKEHNGVLERIS